MCVARVFDARNIRRQRTAVMRQLTEPEDATMALTTFVGTLPIVTTVMAESDRAAQSLTETCQVLSRVRHRNGTGRGTDQLQNEQQAQPELKPDATGRVSSMRRRET